jgi:hypothetical protein
MNIPDLFALTTQTKPSSFLAKAIPQSKETTQFQLGRQPVGAPDSAAQIHAANQFLLAIKNSSTDAVSNSSSEETDDIASVATEETEDTPAANTVPLVTEPDSSRAEEEFTTFLTLLTAQIRNQDPLAPLDSTQFVDQLATFSNLELQAEGNQTLEEIARLLASGAYSALEE